MTQRQEKLLIGWLLIAKLLEKCVNNSTGLLWTLVGYYYYNNVD